MFRYTYKITLLNGSLAGHYYFGQHSTDDLNDGYAGSGRLVTDYYKKYGKIEHQTYIKEIIALKIGEAAMHLGAGRATKEDSIDMSAGILLNKKIGDQVDYQELIATLFTDKDDYETIISDVKECFVIVDEFVSENPLIYDIIK